MRVAYLLLIHNQFDLVEDLIKTLKTENTDFYIHVDKKSLEEFKKNEYLVSQNWYSDHTLTWGGYYLFGAVQSLLNYAVKNYSPEDKVTYTIISGSCFPIKSNQEIYDTFLRNYGIQFIPYAKMGRSVFRAKYLYDYDETGIQIKDASGKRILNPKFNSKLKWVRGSSWNTFSHDFAIKLDDFFTQDPFGLLDSLKNSLLAEEMIWQTTHLNYFPEFKCENSNFRFEIWVGDNAHPHVLCTDEHFDMIKNSDALFARKFTKNSKELRNRIKKELLCENSSASILMEQSLNMSIQT